MRKYSSKALGAGATVLILVLMYTLRPEYLNARHLVLSTILIGAGILMILSYARKEEMYLYTFTLRIGEDDGLRMVGLLFGIFCVTFMVAVTLFRLF